MAGYVCGTYWICLNWLESDDGNFGSTSKFFTLFCFDFIVVTVLISQTTVSQTTNNQNFQIRQSRLSIFMSKSYSQTSVVKTIRLELNHIAMQSVSRSPSYVRKPPSYDSKPKAPERTPQLPPRPHQVDEVLNTQQIVSFRELNPNLQPCSPKEEKEIGKRLSSYVSESTPSSEFNSSTETASLLSSKSTRRSSYVQSVTSIHNLKSKVSSKPQPGPAADIQSTISQRFWKYHILQIGERFLYLTTNPESRHLYCRNAPGVHVEIISSKRHKGGALNLSKGFQLNFRNQMDDDLFMTVTMKKVMGKSEIYLDSSRRFHELGKGDIVSVDNTLRGQSLKGIEKPIKWSKDLQVNAEASVDPIRYEVRDSFNRRWNVGSIPHFKQGNKLKNKRFIFFTSAEDNRLLSCFRSHENRMKKKIIKKLNRMSTAGDSKKFQYFNESDDLHGLDNLDGSVYYLPSDGINEKNPVDDSPNDGKLGWITIMDDELFETPGNWEMVLGFCLAVSLIRISNEK